MIHTQTVGPAMSHELPIIRNIAAEYALLSTVSWTMLNRFVGTEELVVARIDGVARGFARWHTRADGWHTLYVIAVSRSYRRRGLGFSLMQFIPTPIQLRCPFNSPARDFFRSIGMTEADYKPGRRRVLIDYSLQEWK